MNHPIPLNRDLVRSQGWELVEKDIRRIAGSVRFEVLVKDCGIRLMGPDTSYHRADPDLPETLKSFRGGVTMGEILSYKSHNDTYDLCLEDSWTGYFISDHLKELRPQEELVLLHADDHTDMMPTLLVRSGAALIDPAANRIFDPAKREDWETAITSGCVGIGNFVTPLFYAGHKVHVRHLDNGTVDGQAIRNVKRGERRYDVIPDKRFAALCMGESQGEENAGTYLAGSNPETVFHALPEGPVIVHIDLDYFINDFNGNAGQRSESTRDRHDAIVGARCKLDRFFGALHRAAPRIDRWIVATSPGFCSAHHWPALLAAIAEGIQNPGKGG